MTADTLMQYSGKNTAELAAILGVKLRTARHYIQLFKMRDIFPAVKTPRSTHLVIRYCSCGKEIPQIKGKAYKDVKSCGSPECVSDQRRIAGAKSLEIRRANRIDETATRYRNIYGAYVDDGEIQAFVHRTCREYISVTVEQSVHEAKLAQYRLMVGR